MSHDSTALLLGKMFTTRFFSVLALCLGAVFCSPHSERVEIGFYSEALCPDCLSFSNGPLTDAFKEIGDIITLKYVPWGNARIGRDGKFECQHGRMECVMNTVSACVLHYYPNQTDFWPFLHCVDGYFENQNLKIAEKCAGESNMNWDDINSCQAGDMGVKLEQGYANVTNSLSPPHQYTPWVTINGRHDSRAEGKGLIKAVCEAFTGQKVPDACP